MLMISCPSCDEAHCSRKYLVFLYLSRRGEKKGHQLICDAGGRFQYTGAIYALFLKRSQRDYCLSPAPYATVCWPGRSDHVHEALASHLNFTSATI